MNTEAVPKGIDLAPSPSTFQFLGRAELNPVGYSNQLCKLTRGPWSRRELFEEPSFKRSLPSCIVT